MKGDTFSMRCARWAVLLLTAVFLLGISVSAIGAVPSSRNEKVDVLIGFHGSPNPGLVRAFGGQIYREFTIVNVIAARMAPQAVEALARNSMVRYIEPDGPVFALGQTVPWGINRVFGDESHSFDTWKTTKGNGIGVAVLDTGIDGNHDDLPELVDGINTIDSTDWDSDVHGHGTHVAGTIAALDNNVGVVGVAPQVGLYAVKVLNDSGSGTVASVVAGIEWAVTEEIPILNMSLGSSSDSSTLREACDAAYAAGHLVVASAGNSGDPPGRGDSVGYPAKYESVIAVAASDSKDKRASFSSTGPAVELIAPGVGVLSTVPGGYATYSGTSMASPHVAGVAALVWAVDSAMTNLEVRQILRDTAEDLGLSSNHQGFGLVRADLAVAAVVGTEPAPVSATIDPTEAVYDLYATSDVTTTITWNDATVVEEVTGEGIQIGDWSVDVDTLSINSDFLATFDAGTELVFTIGFDVGQADLTVTVIDSTPALVPATIDPTEAVYDLYATSDVTTTITWNDATVVTAVNLDGATLTEDTDYQVADNTLTIFQTFLEGFSDGDTLVFSITFDVGEAVLTVTVVDTTPGEAALTIDSFVLTNTSNPAWARVTVNWAVSDGNGKLDTVESAMRIEGQTGVVASATSSVSGYEASGIHELRVRSGHGETYQVTLTVTDSEGNFIFATETIGL